MMAPSTGYAVSSIAALQAIAASDRADSYARLVPGPGSPPPFYWWYVYDSRLPNVVDPNDQYAFIIPNDNVGAWMRVSSSFKIGSVTTLPQGSQPYVTNSGTPTNVELNFGIPVGGGSSTPTPLTISSISPTQGTVGSSVVITGTGFTGATQVSFNSVSASFTINSDTQITATVPTGATSGSISITNPSGTVQSGTSFTVISSTPTPTPTTSYPSTVLADSPSFYFRLGEKSGTTANNGATPSNVSGVYNGGIVLAKESSLAGDTDTSAAFNGTDSYISINSLQTNPQIYTLETRFKTNTAGSVFGFLDTLNTGGGSFDRQLYIRSDGSIGFYVYPQGETATTGTNYLDNQWHSVAVSVSSTGTKIYVDGVLKGQSSNPGGFNYNGYWHIGYARNSNQPPFFTGLLDEVAIYPTALSADRIAAHYQAA